MRSFDVKISKKCYREVVIRIKAPDAEAAEREALEKAKSMPYKWVTYDGDDPPTVSWSKKLS